MPEAASIARGAAAGTRPAGMGPRALWAGPGARRVLRSGGTGVVEVALRPGGYVRLGDDGWLLVARARAPRGPLSLIVTGLEGAPLRAGAPVWVTDGVLVVAGGPSIALAQVMRDDDASRIAATAPSGGATARAVGVAPSGGVATPAAATAPPGAPLAAGRRAALAAALDAAAAPAADLAPGLAALRRGDEHAAVAALAGRGPGLTPAGDDVLAGYAAWRHAEGAPVEVPAARCSPLGAAYLRCAERGELPDVAAAVLDAVRAGDTATAARRARALTRWGASSGTAILWGVKAAAGA